MLWLRPPGPLPSRSGHVFNSMHATWRVPFVQEPHRFWRTMYCREPMDKLWFASPRHFPKDSPILGPVLDELQGFFDARARQANTRGSGGKVPYNYIMKRVHAKVLEVGLTCDILDPTVMLLVPYWRPEGFLSSDALRAQRCEQGHDIMSVADILRTSIAVTPMLHSTKPKPVKRGVSTATVVAKESLLGQVYSALGLQLSEDKRPNTFWNCSAQAARLRGVLFMEVGQQAAEDCARRQAVTPEAKRRRLYQKTNIRGCGELGSLTWPSLTPLPPPLPQTLPPTAEEIDMERELCRVKEQLTLLCGL